MTEPTIPSDTPPRLPPAPSSGPSGALVMLVLLAVACGLVGIVGYWRSTVCDMACAASQVGLAIQEADDARNGLPPGDYGKAPGTPNPVWLVAGGVGAAFFGGGALISVASRKKP